MNERIAEDQMLEFRELFVLFDTNKDNSIDAKELGAIFKALGYPLPHSEVQDMINEVDGDGNGTIEFPEFIEIISKKIKQTDTESELNDAFNLFDRDRNGLISGAELQYVLSKLGQHLNEEEIREIIEEADLDGDGNLSFQEFVMIMMAK